MAGENGCNFATANEETRWHTGRLGSEKNIDKDATRQQKRTVKEQVKNEAFPSIPRATIKRKRRANQTQTVGASDSTLPNIKDRVATEDTTPKQASKVIYILTAESLILAQDER